MNEHILKLYISMHNIVIMDIDQCFNQLGRNIPNFIQGKWVIVLYVLEERFIASKLHNQTNLCECFYALEHFQYTIMMKILHDVDLLSNVFEFVRVLIHFEFLIHLYCY